MSLMKKLRPIEMPKPQDPYRKAQNGLLRHFALSEAEFRELERERPQHLVVEGDSVLACSAHDGLTFRLSYAYPDRDAFARLFPAMLQRLLEADFEQADAPMGFRLTLTDAPSRPYLEPVLSVHAFELSREWIKMTLLELPKGGPPEEIAPGFALRPARPDDAEAIAELDAAAFPTPSPRGRCRSKGGRSCECWRSRLRHGRSASCGSAPTRPASATSPTLLCTRAGSGAGWAKRCCAGRSAGSEARACAAPTSP